MDIVYALREATAADVHARLPDAPTYTAVRGLLRILVDKRHLTADRDGARLVYRPTRAREAEGTSVLAHVIRTFFDGSPAKAMAALVGSPDLRIDRRDLERLARLVEESGDDEGSPA